MAPGMGNLVGHLHWHLVQHSLFSRILLQSAGFEGPYIIVNVTKMKISDELYSMRMALNFIMIQCSLFIVFVADYFAIICHCKCWLVIGSKTVKVMRPRSNFKTFLHRTAGKF